ncbi:MAG: site-specific DNA-methyltransferase [Saprospiraceae bacterium]
MGKKYSPQANTVWLSDSHDHIIVYAKNKDNWRPNLLPRTVEMDKRYKNPDNDSRGVWKAVDFTISLTGGQRGAQFAKTGESKNIYEITTPSGRKLMPADGRCWAASEDRYKELLAENRIWFGKTGNNVPAQKKFLTEVQSGIVSKTIWFRKEVGDNQEAKKEVKAVNASEIFATPKPERLIERILTLATDNNDIILDSFLGSGTTTAVAHKMNRKWIGIELGDHAYTHCLPRMKKVVDGLDEGGISKSQNWKGGGGFRFYNLAPSLLKKDDFGNWIIEPDYNADMLAAAMAKHEGYHYSPDEQLFWKQGQFHRAGFYFHHHAICHT